MNAFTFAPIFDKLQHRIECLETWGTKLLVGTAESGLLVYDVKEKEKKDMANPTDEGFLVTVSEVYKNFSKGKPINQINVIESHRIMVSLSDGVISVHDLPSFNLRSTLNRAKGCHLYALDTSRDYPSLCAAVKKKLYIYNWDGTDFVESKELNTADLVKALVWADQIFIGYKKEYVLMDPRSGNATDIFPTGRLQNALANFLPPDQILLLKESISILVGFDGKPTRKFGLSWSEPPTAIGYKFPYVVALQPRSVEVRMVTGHQNMFQSINMKTARDNPLKCITDKGEIYVSTANQVWRLVPVPLTQQIDQLMSSKEFEEAMNLCESVSSPDVNKAEKLKQIKNLYAYHLFMQGQYERAMELFSDLDVDPLQVIGLYPNLLPKLVKQKYTYPIDIPDLVGAALEKALHALLVFLAKKRIPYVQQLAAQLQNNTSATPTINQQDNLDYMNCTDTATIIDTSLMKAYIKTNEALLAPLLRTPNFCHVRECQRVLTEFKKYNELILLLKHKKLHREALDILQKLGGGTAGGTADTINYLRSLGQAHMNIIAEYSRWVLNVANPEDALTIFTEERNPQDKLPALQVIGLLKSARPTLVIPYLEFIIENGEKGPELHNELIFQYLSAIKFILNDPVYQENRKNSTMAAGNEVGLLGTTRKKLLKFLEDSQCYQPEKMFKIFPQDDLFEERAILLSRIGQHEKALNIYAHKLKQFNMAEEYCAKHYNAEKEDARDVYLSLLRVYLQPPEPSIPPMVQPAMTLLANHYQRIDTPKALEILPANIPIQELYPFFESVLRDITKNRRNNQVIKNLLKSENLQIREQLIKDRSHVIKITDERTCPVCTKRLGTSVFPCYVNGVVVHYMCLTNLQNQKKPLPPPTK